jgi:hypothetical protein
MYRQRNNQQRIQNRTVFGLAPGADRLENDIRRLQRIGTGYTSRVGEVQGPYDSSFRFSDEEDMKDNSYGPQRPRFLGRSSRVRYMPNIAGEAHIYTDPETFTEQALDYHNYLVSRRNDNIRDVNSRIRSIGELLRRGDADYGGAAGRRLNRALQQGMPIYERNRTNTDEEKTN